MPRISLLVRHQPRVFTGACRHLLLWVDNATPDILAAAESSVGLPDRDAALRLLLATLDLAYGIVFIDRRCEYISLTSGPKKSFSFFYATTKDGLIVRDEFQEQLPDETFEHLDLDGFADFVARSIVTGPFELSCHSETMDRRWKTVPPGHRVALTSAGAVVSSGKVDIGLGDVHRHPLSSKSSADELVDAVDRHLIKLAACGNIASEFSGGIDSTIVRARCLAKIPEQYKGGVTCGFPYPEFKRESEMRDHVLKHAPGTITCIDHRRYLPFAALSEVPPHAEPNLASTAWGAFSSTAIAARQLGASVLLSGHGGDALFRWHPNQLIKYLLPADLSYWFKGSLQKNIEERAAAIMADLNAESSTGFGAGLWHPGMFDPANPQKLLLAGVPGIRYVSGVVSRDILRAGARLWLSTPVLKTHHDKSLAHVAFAEDVPIALWARPGKVDHLGIVYRGAIAARKELLLLARRNSEITRLLGLSPDSFLNFSEQATRGIDSGNLLFSVILAVILWADRPHRRSNAEVELQRFLYDSENDKLEVRVDVRS